MPVTSRTIHSELCSLLLLSTAYQNTREPVVCVQFDKANASKVQRPRMLSFRIRVSWNAIKTLNNGNDLEFEECKLCRHLGCASDSASLLRASDLDLFQASRGVKRISTGLWRSVAPDESWLRRHVLACMNSWMGVRVCGNAS